MYFSYLLTIVFFFSSCKDGNPEHIKASDITGHSTTQVVGGGCDGCEIMYVGMPDKINSTDTSQAWSEKNTRLKIHGKVFKKDGITPAPGIIIYYWHTDHTGVYAAQEGMDEKAKTHGYIRGWLKTNDNGEYTLYTIRPGSYPNSSNPAHIHLVIKEPGINEYYIDDLHFSDDSLLTTHLENYPPKLRGGNGILNPKTLNGVQTADHEIILGFNIPGYP